MTGCRIVITADTSAALEAAADVDAALLKAWIAMWSVIYADQREEIEMPWDLGGEA